MSRQARTKGSTKNKKLMTHNLGMCKSCEDSLVSYDDLDLKNNISPKTINKIEL